MVLFYTHRQRNGIANMNRNFAEQSAKVLKRTQELLKLAGERYGVDTSMVNIRFDLRGRAAGQAGYRISMFTKPDYYIRFNVQMIANGSFDHVYNETIPHEIAHIICYMKPALGRKHDTGWKRVCIALGGTGDRCHNEEVVYAKGETYTYNTTTGHKVNVSQIMHKKIQRGSSYRVRGKGAINNSCDWTRYMVAAETVATPIAKVEHKVENSMEPKTGTKAAKVRELIAQGKSTNKDQAAVIAAVVESLNMNKAMARTYVQNNWNKV